MIEPFFFGPRKAFACYQSANDLSSTELLIICPPLFDEYRRCYRALADLAMACAGHGKHVIRIDYSGTGEAQGDIADFLVEDWIDDINCIVDEGIALTGAESVVLVGVRFGATLAVQCSHPAISRFVLWDPVASGSQYLQWLASIEAAREKKYRRGARLNGFKLDTTDFTSFAIGPALKDGISALGLGVLEHVNHKTYALISNKSREDIDVFSHSQYSGIDYDWPEFHEGNFHPKPVLAKIALAAVSK